MKSSKHTGILFSIFFAWINQADQMKNPEKGRASSVMVLANNVEDAIAKVKQHYPHEVIGSMFEADRNFSPAMKKSVIII